MNVKILGSVSPYLKGSSNCPGYLVEVNNNKILLDCGKNINYKYISSLCENSMLEIHTYNDKTNIEVDNIKINFMKTKTSSRYICNKYNF